MSFIRVGERVRFIGTSRSRYETWPKDKWLEYGVTGTVKEYHPEQPAVRVGDEYFEALPPYAVVRWDFGGRTVIDPDDEGKRWERIFGKKPATEKAKPSDLGTSSPMAPATIYGWLTPPLMEELKKLVELEEWPPPEEPTPIFSTVLQVCDYAFTLKVLKWKCDEMGTGKSGHKKIIIARLLNAGEEELTDIAQRTIAELEDRGLFEEEDIPLEEVTEIARKVVGQ